MCNAQVPSSTGLVPSIPSPIPLKVTTPLKHAAPHRGTTCPLKTEAPRTDLIVGEAVGVEGVQGVEGVVGEEDCQ